jgi:hypothetical protein
MLTRLVLLLRPVAQDNANLSVTNHRKLPVMTSFLGQNNAHPTVLNHDEHLEGCMGVVGTLAHTSLLIYHVHLSKPLSRTRVHPARRGLTGASCAFET